MSRIGSTQRAAVERANRKAVQRRRVRQRLRVVAATAPGLAAGALAMALATPHAVAEVAPAGAMQSVIDQLLDAQQKIIDTNSDYPFIVPSDLSSLQGYTQNLAITTLLLGLNKLNTSSDSITWVPFPWSANVAEPQSPLILPNPDDQYGPIAVDPTATYTVTVNPGAGTQDLSFTANAGNGVTVDFTPVSSLDLADATPNADGTYTIILSATPHDGNWVDISGVGTVMIRNIMGDGGLPHDYITIHQDGATAASSLPELSHDQMITMLGQLAAIMPLVNASGTYYSQMEIPDSLPDNTMTDISATSGAVEGISTPGQISSMGHFELGPDQALIIKAPNLEAGYFGLQLYNDWGQNVPYVTAQGGLNNTQIFQDSDGYTYYVVSSKDPGVANWVDNSSLTDGIVGLRWQNVTGDVTNPDVQTQVVNIADVKDYLPSDTPLVTAEERAALLQERLFDYGYTQDQDHNIDWLGWNLVYNQFKAAMGPEAFEQIFGGQTDVPTVLDRMTDPSLMPNLDAVASEFLTNPAGSLAALIGNLPLAIKDVELPILLASLSMKAVIDETAQAVQGDLSSGDWTQAWAELSSGLQGLGTLFDDAFTDPATGIMAGLLNARDDMATGILHAGNSFDLSGYSPLTDSLVDLNQQVMAALLG